LPTSETRFVRTTFPDSLTLTWCLAFFAQDDVNVASWLSLSASGRVDFHNVYGIFFSPRLSALVRKGGWASRISAGQGFYAATPLTEETEAAGLARLLLPAPLRASVAAAHRPI
jgi:iron complex outermembrane receptor protein